MSRMAEHGDCTMKQLPRVVLRYRVRVWCLWVPCYILRFYVDHESYKIESRIYSNVCSLCRANLKLLFLFLFSARMAIVLCRVSLVTPRSVW